MAFASVNQVGNSVNLVSVVRNKKRLHHEAVLIFNCLSYLLENIIAVAHIIQPSNIRTSIARSRIVIKYVAASNSE